MSDSLIPLGQIIRLTKDLLDENGKPKHRYYHTTWNFTTPPYIKVPFHLDCYNPATKTFQITVLTDKSVLDSITLQYPAVPITEEQAQALVDQRRTPIAGKGQAGKQPVTPNISVLPELSPMPRAKASDPAPEPSEEDENTPEPEAPKEEAKPRPPTDGRPSVRSLIIKGLMEGKVNRVIIADVQIVYPEKSHVQIRNMIGVTKWGIKDRIAAAQAAKEAK